MKQTFLSAILIFTSFLLSAQTPALNWVDQIVGPSWEFGNSIAVDASGNVYTAGIFGDTTTDFDPGPGVFHLLNGGGFITKMNSAGGFVWAKATGGYVASFVRDYAGNFFISGTFWSTEDFDPGPGVYNLTPASANQYDVFLTKLDSSGNFLWCKQFGASQNDFAGPLVCSSDGSVYFAGSFNGTVDFDPGPGVFNLTATGYSTAFLCKLDASGNFLWAIKPGGGVASLALDASGNLLVCGAFSGTVDFNPGTGVFNLTASAGSDSYLLKLDPSHNFLWAEKWGGAYYDGGGYLAIDPSGNILIAGSFTSTVDFDPGSGTFNYTSKGDADIFISKLDSLGNFIWAKQIGGPDSNEIARSIATDADGNIYTSGTYYSNTDFDPGAGTYILPWVGYEDVFVCKLDASSNFDWAVGFGGPNVDMGDDIKTDPDGNVYTTGNFSDSADFAPGLGTHILYAQYADVYIYKLSQLTDCNHPIGAYTDAITKKSAKAHWDAVIGANKYKLQYRITGTNTWTNVSTTNTYRKFSNLLANTQYDWHVRSVCADLNLGNSGWSPLQHFTTLPMKLSEESVISLEAYPNPTSDYFNINTSQLDPQSVIYIYDLTGRLVESHNVNGSEMQIGESLSNGVYFLKIDENNETQQVIKLVKNF